jgi:hypothetical protein
MMELVKNDDVKNGRDANVKLRKKRKELVAFASHFSLL